MGKSNIKFDINTKELKKTILNAAREEAYEMDIDIECPECGKHFDAHAGANVCPFCKATVDLDVQVDF